MPVKINPITIPPALVAACQSYSDLPSTSNYDDIVQDDAHMRFIYTQCSKLQQADVQAIKALANR